MYPKVFLILLGIAIIASCSKDSSTNGEPTKKQLLTTVAWHYVNAGIDANGDGTIDTALPDGTLEDCDKDNTYIFQPDGTGTMNEGATKCDPSKPQTVPFQYSANPDVTVINFPDTVINGVSGDVNVLLLNATHLTLQKSVEVGLPIPVSIIVELKH